MHVLGRQALQHPGMAAMSDSGSMQIQDDGDSDSEVYDKLNPAQLGEKLNGLKQLWAGERLR